MKALVYEKAHRLEEFSMHLAQVPEPDVRDLDVLVDVRAVGINPGEAFIRRTRSAEPGGRVLLGWEFAGVIVHVGPGVRNLAVGNRVFGTGDVSRDGAWAERVAVDCRVVAKIPDALSFADAASLPIGAATAWEAMFRVQADLPPGTDRVLVIGGAGAVGSMATQLLKSKTNAFVISTASRAESRAWCNEMGADLVVDHAADVAEQLASANVPQVDLVLSTAASAKNVGWIGKVLRPFGHVSIVDMPVGLDVGALMSKSASLHTEMVFSRILHGCAPERQGAILEDVAARVSSNHLRPIATTRLRALTPETMREAHSLVESGRTIGKVVIEA
jgi:NADPH2:quinone reductase